jgi:CheY-like chemotaxis protein
MRRTSFSTARHSGKLLIVDDNRYGLIARKSVLQELGHDVTTATTGDEALELFSRESFDVVITDYRMPGMDGLELIRHIRERKPSTGIILLSGFVDPLGFSEETTGADVVISKSAGEIAALLHAVNRLLSRHVPKKPAVSERNLISQTLKSVP